jgi:pyridoxine 5-phosphate synthase
MALVRPAIASLKAIGARVILFIDPDPTVLARIPASGADGVEIYTGAYAAAYRSGTQQALLDACAETARVAAEQGLVVNAGHDLNLLNLPPLIERMPKLAEASIGHELTADALVMGFAAAVRAYTKALAATP